MPSDSEREAASLIERLRTHQVYLLARVREPGRIAEIGEANLQAIIDDLDEAAASIAARTPPAASEPREVSIDQIAREISLGESGNIPRRSTAAKIIALIETNADSPTSRRSEPLPDMQ